MISLPCTSCKTVLQIDDAFAGGVCRCQHCGTIQTVPAKSKTAVRAGAPAAPKTLYQKKNPAGTEAAAIVPPASSPAETRARPPQPVAPSKKLPIAILIAIAAALLVLVGTVVWGIMRFAR